MEQGLKSFKIGSKILAGRSNELWNIKNTKKLARNTMTTKIR